MEKKMESTLGDLGYIAGYCGCFCLRVSGLGFRDVTPALQDHLDNHMSYSLYSLKGFI